VLFDAARSGLTTVIAIPHKCLLCGPPITSGYYVAKWQSLATLIICWTLLLQIFRSEGPVTSVSLQAAIAVYLLFGSVWANAYMIAMRQNPHSFQSTVELSSSYSEEWMYYSFVTLTTLGYGEITPRSQVARSLAIGEALVGQPLSRHLNRATRWQRDVLWTENRCAILDTPTAEKTQFVTCNAPLSDRRFTEVQQSFTTAELDQERDCRHIPAFEQVPSCC
jgi:hypothetical protein